MLQQTPCRKLSRELRTLGGSPKNGCPCQLAFGHRNAAKGLDTGRFNFGEAILAHKRNAGLGRTTFSGPASQVRRGLRFGAVSSSARVSRLQVPRGSRPRRNGRPKVFSGTTTHPPHTEFTNGWTALIHHRFAPRGRASFDSKGIANPRDTANSDRPVTLFSATIRTVPIRPLS